MEGVTRLLVPVVKFSCVYTYVYVTVYVCKHSEARGMIVCLCVEVTQSDCLWGDIQEEARCHTV